MRRAFPLQAWPKTLLVVSHARDFLNSVCTDIVHLHNRKLTHYKGNFDSFETQLAERNRCEGKRAEAADRKKKHMQARRPTVPAVNSALRETNQGLDGVLRRTAPLKVHRLFWTSSGRSCGSGRSWSKIAWRAWRRRSTAWVSSTTTPTTASNFPNLPRRAQRHTYCADHLRRVRCRG